MKTLKTKIISIAALSGFLLIALITTVYQNEVKAWGGIDNLPPVQAIRIQANNISVPFLTNGVMCGGQWYQQTWYGTIWPVTAPWLNEINYAAGLWVGAKVVLSGNQKELRLAAAFYNSHFSPGNIPVAGGVPPQSVCDDPKWRGYLVCLTDPSLVNGGTRIKIAGGIPFTFNYDAWSLWPVQLGAPYVEVNGIAGYQPGWNADRPGIGNSDARPDDLLYMVYMDYTNCTNNIHLSEISLPGGSLPLGVEMQQLSFAFNCPPLRDMYFVKWKIINKSGKQWDSTYIAYADDIDIGSGTASSRDDAVGCDSLRDMGFIYNSDNIDPSFGLNPPAMGYRFLQGPLKYTGNSNDTAKLPYDTLVGFRILGLETFTMFINSSPDPCLNDPDNYVAGYNFMRGLDGCGRTRINPITGQPTTLWYTGDACHRIGWFDSAGHDVRFLMGSGPLTMNSLDTQAIVLAGIVGHGSNNFQNVCHLQTFSDSALSYYYSGFCNSLIGVKKISGTVPNSFALYQNYPNPFNPVTVIRFDIPEFSHVELTVYNMLGVEAARLADREFHPGHYEIDWNGTEFASGVYIYRLETESFTDTKKMVLMK